jgi:hypothetical protein
MDQRLPNLGEGAGEVIVTRAGADQARQQATNRIRRWFDDMGTYIVGAALLVVLGSLFLAAAVQSPSMLQWTGTAVGAVEDGGISYYSFHGQNYTLNVTSTLQHSSTVYVDPADPSNAILSNPVARWTDIASVGGPYAAAVLLLALGLARRSRRRHLRERDPGPSFGGGLDRTTLGRLRERQRRTGT